MTQEELERKLFIVRKRTEAAIAASAITDKHFFYIPSLSTQTIVYKGLLLAPQILSALVFAPALALARFLLG